MLADQVHGALLEQPGRLARGVALDPAIGRVGGVPGDPGERERAAVDPGSVVVPVGKVDGPVGHHAVEELPGGAATVEGLHGPAAAGDPLLVGVGVGVGPYGRQGVGRRTRAREVAARQLDARRHRMHMGVLESRDQQLAREVDDFGLRADQLAHLVVADGGDALTGDGHGGGAGAGGVQGEDRAAGEHEVGGGVAHVRIHSVRGWIRRFRGRRAAPGRFPRSRAR